MDSNLPQGWEPFDGNAPLDSHPAQTQPPQQPMAAPQAPAQAPQSAQGWQPFDDSHPLDPAPQQAQNGSQDQQPIIISALRPKTSVGSNVVDPSYTVKGFSNEVQPDYQAHSALSASDKGEYARFFPNLSTPQERAHAAPSAAMLQTWYKQKTGADLGDAQAIVDFYVKHGTVNTNEHIDIPAKHQGGIAAGLNHVANGAAMDWGSEAGAALSATGQSAANLVGLGNGQDWTTNWANQADLNHAQLAQDSADHPWWSAGGELLGAAATIPVTGSIGEAAGVGQFGSAATKVAQAAESSPVLTATTRGALEGATFGAGAAGPGNRGEGAAGGAILGAGTGAAMTAAGNALAAKAQDTAAGRRAAFDAADRLNTDFNTNIQPTLATTNGPLTKALTAGSEATIIGGHMVRKNISNLTEQTGQAADAISKSIAPHAMDRSLEAGVDIFGHDLANFSERERSRLDGLYQNAEALAGNPTLQAPKTVQFLDDEIARLKAADEDTSALSNLRKFFAKGQPLTALRDKRSIALGSSFDRSNNDIVNGALKRAWSLSGEDIRDGLDQAGKSAAGMAYGRADGAYAQSIADRKFVDSLLQKSPEQLADTLTTMSRKDGLGLNRVLGMATKQNADNIRAGLVENLGKAPAGAPDAGVWNPNMFATNWNKMSNYAKNVYPDETRRALDDLATIAQQGKLAGTLRNNSNTANALNVIELLRSAARVVVPVGGAYAARTNPGGIVAEAAGSAILGTALTSPRFARTLVAIQKKGSIGFAISRLSVLSSRMASTEGKQAADAMLAVLKGQHASATPYNGPMPTVPVVPDYGTQSQVIAPEDVQAQQQMQAVQNQQPIDPNQ